jgi:hypothetical protein
LIAADAVHGLILQAVLEAKMPRTNSGLKDPKMYEKLVAAGAPTEKAARISNAAARDGRSVMGAKGGESGSYQNWTVHDLRTRAKEIGLHHYSSLRKDELINELRHG